MGVKSSLPFCSTPAAPRLSAVPKTAVDFFDVTLHICQTCKVSTAVVYLARNASFIDLAGHDVDWMVEVVCAKQPNMAENRGLYSLSLEPTAMLCSAQTVEHAIRINALDDR